MRKHWVFLIAGGVLLLAGVLAFWPAVNPGSKVGAAVNIYASPIQAGCYISGPNECRIHVEPFSIDIASGMKLVRYQLVTIQGGSSIQTIIHDFRPDQSNPVPYIGSTFSPSLVAQDYIATCGKSYEVSLQGQDTGDLSLYNLGLTGQFTCPSGMP